MHATHTLYFAETDQRAGDGAENETATYGTPVRTLVPRVKYSVLRIAVHGLV